MYYPVKHSMPVFENQVATKNVANKSEGKAKTKVFTLTGSSMIKNLHTL